MLEKIGLPAKPSMRGGNWVLDASHCQGCSSQFTFINRKHHCRRCGGLFCNSCTQQRMILRGQGDSPVRICEPCKKLEESARFELRYGHRKRTTKVNTKQIVKSEDEVMDQILGTGGKHASEHEPDNNLILDLQRLSSSASCSNIIDESASPHRGDTVRSVSVDTRSHGTLDIVQGDPEELRQQAVEEKKKYKSLKAEGKSEEALQAFKRGKELERQAGVLEIALRKNRRMASKALNSSTVGIQKTDSYEGYGGKEKLTSQKGKETKDDLAAELRELGWSDADFRDSDKKPVKLSLEGELSNLLAEVVPRPAERARKDAIDKSEVIALKKKALLLKREGKLAEAKEELKRAKILEKQIEEQELLGGAEDSDDELYALINAIDNDKQDGLVFDHVSDAGLKFDNIFVSDDLPTDGNFEATDDDMHDPDLVAALKSFGWSEEDEEQPASQGKKSVDCESLQKQVLSLKREALSQKRAGNTAEAMELLKKAKLLEKDLEGLQSSSEVFASGLNHRSASPQVPVAAMESVEKENALGTGNSPFKSQPKSKLMIQKELLALKKKALTLRREGRIDEAEEELKKGKVLEQQLEEMESAPKNHEELRRGKTLERQQEEMEINHYKTIPKVGKKNLASTHLHADGDVRSLDFEEEAFETDVTEQDMQDPALLSILENLGWNENDSVESVSMLNATSEHDSIPPVAPRNVRRTKADVQKELLTIKRKALALRRQGNIEAAEEELEKAKALENQMAEMEASNTVNFMEVDLLGSSTSIPPNFPIKDQGSGNGSSASLAAQRIPNDEVVSLQNVFDVALTIKSDKPEAASTVPKMLQIETLMMSGESAPPAVEIPVEWDFAQQLNQNHKMVELPSGNDGKALHSMMHPMKREDRNVNVKPGIHYVSKENTTSEGGELSKTTSDFPSKDCNASKINSSASLELKSVHGVDARRDEIIARKRKAVTLKREGKLAEAREELRQAKLLEKNLEAGQQDIVVKEAASTSTCDNTPTKKENKSPSEKPMSGRDRFKIQQESLSHKRNALKLRRAGKIDEADAELDLAKSLEKQLEEYDQGSGGKSEATDDVAVEDLLDPQLLSALRAIGLDDAPATKQPPKQAESPPISGRRQNHPTEKADLEEQIKAEKLRALHFKREGKQAEALESLRSAKRLEKKLASLA